MRICLWILPFLIFCLSQAESFQIGDTPILLIDSGREDTGNFYGMRWWSDKGFIRTGKNKLIDPKINVPGYLTTLRFFPKGDENCYKLPLSTNSKFLIRAGFYYGNYDGKSNPPVFNLTLGGEYWTTVDTSTTDDPIFHEAVYVPKNTMLSVCLVRSQYGGVPFISSLEAAVFWVNEHPKYKLMGDNTALKLVNRTNFGGHQIIGPWPAQVCQEFYGRVWVPKSLPYYPNNNFDIIACETQNSDNDPPSAVLKTSISAPDSSSSITFPIDFITDSPQTAYFVFYFYSNMSWNSTDTRMMEVFIDGVSRNVTQLTFHHNPQVVSLYPVTVKGTANVTISPFNHSTLPPILNAMEVFTAVEIIEQPTSGALQLFCRLFSINLLSVLLLYV